MLPRRPARRPAKPPARRPDQNLGASSTGALGAGFPSSKIVRARLVLIQGSAGSGIFVYNQAGALAGAWVGIASTDPIDHVAVGQGVTSRSGDGSISGVLNADNLTLLKSSGAFVGPAVSLTDSTLAAPNNTTINATVITTPEVLLSNLSAAPGAPTNSASLFALNGTPQQQIPSGLTGAIPAVQIDHTSITVTATGANTITKTWSIPANDAKVDTTYRLTAWGFGTNASGALVNPTVAIGLNGSSTGVSATLNMPGAVTNPLRWRFVIDFHVLTTGAGGTADFNMTGGIYPAVATAQTGTLGVAGSSAAGGTAFNTTASNTLELMWGWASTTGAPTATCIFSSFERLGP